MAPSKYVGVDGCKGGWFSVGLEQNGNFCESKVFEKFGQLLEHYKDAELILVDIPIGLPEDGNGRNCDGEAWVKLGFPRGMSVFPTPTRQTTKKAADKPLQKDHHISAKVEKETSCKGLSIQAFSIAPKIAEVDKALLKPSRSPTPQVREIHPELCFWALNNGCPMEFRKKCKEGQSERLRVLEKVEAHIKKIFEEACSKFKKKDVGRDDILDALVAAVTAYKGHTQGPLQTLPEGKTLPTDLKELPMEMVYWRRPDS